MIVDREVTIDAPAGEVFARVVDIPFVGACLPGARDVTPDPDDPSSHRGRFEVKVGPVSVGLQGSVTVADTDPDGRRAVLRLRGSDRRIGGDVVGEMTLGVDPDGADRSVLAVHTDVTVSGKLGQFGQAVMVKKADQITERFVAEFSRRLLAAGEPVPDTPAAPDTRPIAQPRSPAATPLRTGDPYVVAALLGRHRRLWRDGDPLATGTAPVWQTGAVPARRGGPRIVELAVADETELGSGPDGLGATDASTLVAITPRAGAVGHPETLAALLRAAVAAGRAAIPVAHTPWQALAVARVAAAENAPGVAVVLDAGVGTRALLELSIGEIRAAGLNLPILAGVVPDGPAARAVLDAGADGVVVGGRPGLRARVCTALGRLVRRG